MRNPALLWTSLVLILGGAAVAEQQMQGGRTSGSATGQHVTPSTVTQKSFEGRSGFIDQNETFALDASALAAGAPGVEGKPGAQSGPAPRGRGTTSKFVY